VDLDVRILVKLNELVKFMSLALLKSFSSFQLVKLEETLLQLFHSIQP
jgi:hypothetical protein